MSVFSGGNESDGGAVSTKEQPVLSYAAASVWASDMATLQSGAWLNDNIITLWEEILAHDLFKTRSDFAFMHPSACFMARFLPAADLPEAFQGLDLAKKVLAFIPINDNEDPGAVAAGSHWSLLLWNKRDGQFYHYDSSPDARNRAAATRTAAALFPVANGAAAQDQSVVVVHVKTPLQQNGYDCGVYLCAIANAIAMNDGPTELHSIITPASIVEYRKGMLSMASDLEFMQRPLGSQKPKVEDEDLR